MSNQSTHNILTSFNADHSRWKGERDRVLDIQHIFTKLPCLTFRFTCTLIGNQWQERKLHKYNNFQRYLTRLFIFIYTRLCYLPVATFIEERGKNPFSYLTTGFPRFFPVFPLHNTSSSLPDRFICPSRSAVQRLK